MYEGFERSSYKFLIYPACWCVAKNLSPSTTFLTHVILATGFRYLVNHSFQFAAHTETISGRLRIHDKNPPAEQLLRELDWDNPLIGSVVAGLVVQLTMLDWVQDTNPFSWQQVAVLFLSHYLVVEPLYYAFHRLLHKRGIYQLSHNHHHASVVTESLSGTSHPFGETVVYLLIFSLAIIIPLISGYFSYALIYIYFIYFDIMNCIGHCNFEVVPLWMQWGPLKYLTYSSSYHSLHHSRFVMNFCLFCPIWDYLFGTACMQSYKLQSDTRNAKPKSINAVFLVHGIEWNSAFHMPQISPYLASQRCSKKEAWMYPFAPISILATFFVRCVFQTCFTAQRWSFKHFSYATWSTPFFGYSYALAREYPAINRILLKAVKQAQEQGATHVGLGALNKAVFVNSSGRDLVAELPKDCPTKIVTGNTLTSAVVYSRIRQQVSVTEEIFFTGATSAVGTPVVLRLLEDGYRVKIMTRSKDRFDRLKKLACDKSDNLTKADRYEDGSSCRIWLLGSSLTKAVSKIVEPGTEFLEFAVPPSPSKFVYPFTIEPIGNVKFDPDVCDLTLSCDCEAGEMPACCAATIIHALEGTTEHEVGEIDERQFEWWLEMAKKYNFKWNKEVQQVGEA
jgi:sterol desaturase/sphingolipid hydroxylase (fatty acid hydroxylase superfamily)